MSSEKMKIEMVVTFRNKKYKLSDEIDESLVHIARISRDINRFLSMFVPRFEIIVKEKRGDKN